MIRSFLFAGILSAGLSQAAMINGAGSTFAEPIYSKWFSEYSKDNKGSTFNYQGIGSGGGIRQLIAGTVDFAGTDAPLTKEESDQAKKEVLHVPVALGAVVVSYNLPLSEPLQLTGPVVADIFSGKITKWNASQIQELNKNIKLPDQAIAVATRSDGSGTTAVFTDYLSKVSTDWLNKAGKSVKWFPGSLGAKGNAGVAGLIKQAPGTIGYIELVYALENKLPFALIKNKSGQFVKADLSSVTAAASGISKDMLKAEYKLSITDSTMKGAYPIFSFTWMLVFKEMGKEKGMDIVKFAKWTMSDSAQKKAKEINYAEVPADVRKEVLKSLEQVKVQ